MNKSVLDIVRLLPKRALCDRKIKIYTKKDKIILKRFNSLPVKMHRYVKLDNNLGIFVGLILTEGLQSQEKKSRSIFALQNTDSDIIITCLSLIKEKFGFSLKICKFSLLIPPLLKDNYKKIENMWKQKLNLPKKIKMNHYIQIDLKKPKFAIFIHRSVFRFVVDYIIQESLKHVKKHEEFRIGFLKGVFAAEGSIELRKNGSLHFVYFSQCNDKNRRIIKQALALCGIKFKERLNPHSKDVRISHLHNFETLYKLNICSICERKEEKFRNGLCNLRKNPHAGRSVGQTKKEIIQLLGKGESLTMSQIASKLNISRYTIWDHISRKNRANIFESIKPVGKKRNRVGRSATLWALK